MPRLRLPGNRWVEVTKEMFAKVESWKENRSIQPSAMVDLGNGTKIALSGIQELEDTPTVHDRGERFDIFRDRAYLEQFGKRLVTFGDDCSFAERFRRYCVANRYVTVSGSVNVDKTREYASDREVFSAFMKLEDWKNAENASRERLEFGPDMIPTNASRVALDRMIVGVNGYIASRPGIGPANRVLERLDAKRRKMGADEVAFPELEIALGASVGSGT